MTYQEALQFIHETYQFGSKLGLTNIGLLLDHLDNPEKKVRVIHVAGTNGKGSVCAMLHAVLMGGGYKTGLYTSPYLHRFNERIQVNGQQIPDGDLADLTELIQDAVYQMLEEGYPHPTEFEVVTALGFLFFAREQVDVVVLEVGMGGRLDATNVVSDPLITLITPVGYDHTEHLGDTLAKIAREKAGIIKPNCPVVTGFQKQEALEVIRETAEKNHAPLFQPETEKLMIHEHCLQGQSFSVVLNGRLYTRVPLALSGRHQIDNAMLALRGLQVLTQKHQFRVEDSALRQGLGTVRWAGRMEVLDTQPLFLLDGAHNEAGAKVLADGINELIAKDSLTLLIGLLKEKDATGILAHLLPLADRIMVTQPDHPRGLEAEDLARLVRQKWSREDVRVRVEPDAVKAASKAYDWTPRQGVVLCCGSLYLLGPVRQFVVQRKPMGSSLNHATGEEEKR